MADDESPLSNTEPPAQLTSTFYLTQYVNNILACVFALFINGYIISRMLRLNSTLNGYQYLVIAQEVIICLGAVFRFVRNRIALPDGDLVRLHFFMPSSKLLEILVACATRCLETIEVLLVGVCNVHRMLFVLRPEFIKPFFCIAVPLILTYSTLDATLFYYESESLEEFLFMILLCTDIAVLPCTFIIVLVCFIVLKRHFSAINYSDQTKRLQDRLSKSILIQIAYLTLAGLLWNLPTLCIPLLMSTNVSYESLFRVIVWYNIVLNIILAWRAVVVGLVIKWSVAGFLKKSRAVNPKREVAPVSVNVSRTVQNHTETKQDVKPKH